MHVKEIQVVHEPELRGILEKLQILTPLENGEIACGVCGCEVKPEDVGCIYADSGVVRVCCDRGACLQAVTEESADV